MVLWCLLPLLISQLIQTQPSPEACLVLTAAECGTMLPTPPYHWSADPNPPLSEACLVLTAAEYGTMLPILIGQLTQTQPSPEACLVLTAAEYGTMVPTPASHWSPDPNPTIT
jgi:hypothetical protein